MKNNKLLSAILAALLLASSFTACGEESKETESESKSNEAQSESVKDTEAEETGYTVAERGTTYYENLPKTDYDGETLSLIGKGSDGGDTCIYYEEITGDGFLDELHNRILRIESDYNITFSQTKAPGNGTDPGDVMAQDVMANMNSWQIAADYVEWMDILVTGGYSIPLTDLNVNLDEPYWDQGARESYTVNGHLYYGFADIGWDHYGSSVVLFYNGKLLTENGIEDSPNELYKEGKWTFDKMYEMIQTVISDKNGDGRMTYGEDIFGLTGLVHRLQPALPASGVDIIGFDEDTQTLNTYYTDETVVKVGEWLYKIVCDSNISSMENDDWAYNFSSNLALFNTSLLGMFRSLRDMEDDYGIISWPSVEENMESKIYVRNPLCVVVPMSVPDTDFVADMLNALAAYGYDYIVDDYIQRTVVGRGARDEDSAEFVYDLTTRRAYDTTATFGVPTLASGWETAVRGQRYASIQKTAEKAAKKVSQVLDELYPVE